MTDHHDESARQAEPDAYTPTRDGEEIGGYTLACLRILESSPRMAADPVFADWMESARKFLAWRADWVLVERPKIEFGLTMTPDEQRLRALVDELHAQAAQAQRH